MRLLVRNGRSAFEELPADARELRGESTYLLEGQSENLDEIQKMYPEFCGRLRRTC